MAKKIEDKIIKISDEILNILLEFRKKNPDFTFSLRQRDSPQSKDKRLEKGFWFQGSNYIYVPLFRKGDNARKIKTIGFVIGFGDEEKVDNYIEISFKGGSNDNEKAFYNELASFYNVNLKKDNFGYYFFSDENYTKNIEFYLGDFRNKALELLDKYSLKSQFIISEVQFNKALGKIDEIKNKLKMSPQEKTNIKETLSVQKSDMKLPLNQILYGPPGTGKTYNTINKAISIANPKFNLNQDRLLIKKEYNRLVETGQIIFTTFHQSMGYEDFVEGIKPIIEEDSQGGKTIIYDIEDGIFKKIVGQSKKIDKVDTSDIDWNNLNYYKMSLGGKNNPQEHSYCIYNNLGGISWGGNNDLTELASITDWGSYKKKFLEKFPNVTEKSKFHIQASFTLLRMKEDDIVIATRGNHIIDAIGKVAGEYIFNDENPTSLLHFRKIDWFAKDLNLSPEKFLKKNISQQSIYQFYNDDIRLDSFKELTSKNDLLLKNYVLIIDEINRGNISQIFGELITLIEEDKRLGNDESLEIMLPYSKEKFGVPPNLYIIGTMNTADRSVEALDTALRRRFCFEEMLPRVELLSPSAIYCKLLWDYKDVGWKDSEFVAKENNLFELIGVSQDFKDNRESIWAQMNKDKNLKLIKNDYFKDFKYSGVNLENLLQIINDRIEILLDRDHTIGHSFFIGINSFEDLKTVFQNNIVPLLQEYFFGDYEKIALVLGEGFVECIEANENNVKFAKWKGRSLETPEITRSFRLKNNIESIEEAIKLLLNE